MTLFRHNPFTVTQHKMSVFWGPGFWHKAMFWPHGLLRIHYRWWPQLIFSLPSSRFSDPKWCAPLQADAYIVLPNYVMQLLTWMIEVTYDVNRKSAHVYNFWIVNMHTCAMNNELYFFFKCGRSKTLWIYIYTCSYYILFNVYSWRCHAIMNIDTVITHISTNQVNAMIPLASMIQWLVGCHSMCMLSLDSDLCSSYFLVETLIY